MKESEQLYAFEMVLRIAPLISRANGAAEKIKLDEPAAGDGALYPLGVGRRVQDIEATNGVAYLTNKFIWDGQALVEQRGNAGTNLVRRFFAQGEQISGTNYYFTTDHLGSIREVVNGSGVVQSRYDYDPFGRQVLIAGTATADFGFAGMYYHAISSLSLTLNRAYSADLGRWLSRDPLAEEAGLNLYAYAANNPINGLDIFGLSACSLFGNGINNTLSAIGDSMGLGLYDLFTDNWSQDQGQWDQISDLMYSMDTPENPAATPYQETALGVSGIAALGALGYGISSAIVAAVTPQAEKAVVAEPEDYIPPPEATPGAPPISPAGPTPHPPSDTGNYQRTFTKEDWIPYLGPFWWN